MSTKTLRKRIALVAVSALGAGLLSVVAAPSANAGNTTNNTLQISTTASTTGAGVASPTMATQRSLGWVTQTSTTAVPGNGGLGLTSGAAATGIVLAGARIAFSVGGNATASNGISVVVTGGTVGSIVAEGADAFITTSGTITPFVNGSATTAVATQNSTTAANLSGLFSISAAAGSTATLAAYSGTGITGTSSATNGALLGIWTFSVAAASASGVVSLADSFIFQQAGVARGTVAAGSNRFDTASRMNNGQVGIIQVELNDAYTSDITTGTLTATASNGSGVRIADATSDTGAETYAATSSFHSLTPAASNYIYVNQPTSGVAGSTTVTITHNGTVLATKTLNWNGDVASLTFDSANSSTIFNNGQTEDSAYAWSDLLYVAKDAAGNTLNLTTLPTIDSATGALVGASLGATQNTTSGVLQTAAAGYGTATMVVPTSALNGAGTFMLKLSNAAGTSIKSAVINATVSNGSLNSFVASWDKASYAPGEIAVLTVTGKDAYGNAIYDGATAAGLSLTVAGSATAGFTAVGTACTTSTAFSGGKFTCKYAANTEGAWSFSVDVTTATPQSPSVGALKITAGGATSNADVLKAIVSLIASINKQIAALQKALLKR